MTRKLRSATAVAGSGRSCGTEASIRKNRVAEDRVDRAKELAELANKLQDRQAHLRRIEVLEHVELGVARSGPAGQRRRHPARLTNRDPLVANLVRQEDPWRAPAGRAAQGRLPVER